MAMMVTPRFRSDCMACWWRELRRRSVGSFSCRVTFLSAAGVPVQWAVG